MRIKKIVMGTVVAGGVGLASLGAGAGVASAAPQAPSHSQQQATRSDQGGQNYQSSSRSGAPTAQPGPVRRPDHRPFTYRGHQVTPTYDQHHHAWGFWFFGFWVPLAR